MVCTVLSIEKQHVKGRERRTANSYRWWCFGHRYRQSCDIARPQGNCVALRLPLHNCGGMVLTYEAVGVSCKCGVIDVELQI
jgi:hypothetical protein